jgi:hypothetical protein
MVVMNDYLESKKEVFSDYYRYVLTVSFSLSLLICVCFQHTSNTTPAHVSVPDKYRSAGLEVLSFACVKVESGEWEKEDVNEDELRWR